MTTVEEIRNEIADIARDLRAEETAAANQLDGLNSIFYTTTTEYLVEIMGLIQSLRSQSSIRSARALERLDAVERSARRLANLR
jgi:predicted Zn-dependent peptidase